MLEGAFHDKDTDSMLRIRALESRLWAWFHSLPLHFRFDPNAKQPEDFDSPESKKQYVQSVLLYIIIHHNILVLFRKPLLSHMSPASRKPCFEAAFAVADSWKILQDSFPKMARVTWMHWFRAFHAALICLVVIRTDGPRSEFRSRALTCWMSCLRIFARINDQNGSIMSCWRALSRLDVVVKKEMNADRPPRRYSNHKQLRDSSSQLLISSPAGTRAEFNPFSPTIQELGRSAGNIPEVSPLLTTSISPENTYAYASNSHAYALPALASNPQEPQVPVSTSAVDPSLDTNIRNGFGNDLSGSIFGTQELDIFDMDVQNWPSWLTDQHSPDFT